MTAENFIKAQLADFAWRQAHRFGGADGMLAVAHVVRNRARAGWHGGETLKILQHAHDADSLEGCACDGGCGRCVSSLQPDLRDDNIKLLLRSIDDIYSGLTIDKYTNEAGLYYCELRSITRPWFLLNIVRNPEEHPKIADVGPLSFFK